MPKYNSRADHVKDLIANRKAPAKSKVNLEHISSSVREVSTSELKTEDVERAARVKDFLARRRSDPDHVKKQIEKRKAKLGLSADPTFPAR